MACLAAMNDGQLVRMAERLHRIREGFVMSGTWKRVDFSDEIIQLEFAASPTTRWASAAIMASYAFVGGFILGGCIPHG